MLNETTRLGELEIQISGANPTLVVFSGKSNHRDPDGVLRPLFGEITKRVTLTGGALELHFESLEFFNSSTITSIIHFIKDLRSRQVTTRVTYNASHKWQKVFFDALGLLQKTDGFLQITAVSP
jgi:hypothetical protein